MNLLSLTTSILLMTIAKSQNTSQCRGIYDNNLEIYALDVCATNTLLGAGFQINQKYICENGEVYSQYWFYNNGEDCSGVPNSQPRVDTTNAICNGIYNCSYALIRVYEYNNNCEDHGIWADRAIMTDICQPSTNTSDTIGSLQLLCDRNEGVKRVSYPGVNCDGDPIKEEVTFPSTGNNTCVINNDGVMGKFISCNSRKNATAPIPYPTESPTVPTPKPSAGGSFAPSMSPTEPTLAPTHEQTDETWFITALVFICMFGVLLCCMLWLAYTAFGGSRGKEESYDRAPTDEEAGVETTNYN